MEGFKNTTRMKTFGDVAPQAYAKGGSVKPMAKAAAKAPAKKADAKYPVKRKDGDLANMTPAERRASMEEPSRAMTPAQTRSLQAFKAAKAAAPKQGPLIKPAREMTPAERRMNQMDRPTNSRGAEAYKGGGKVGGSKVPFAVKKVMRKAEGGVVSQIPEMPNEPMMPSAPMGAAPEVRPAYESMPEYIAMQKQMANLRAQDAAGRAQLAAQDRAATMQAQQEMAAQAQMDQGLGRGLAPMYGRGAPPRFLR